VQVSTREKLWLGSWFERRFPMKPHLLKRSVCPGTLNLPAGSENGSVDMARAKRYAVGFLAVLAIVVAMGVSAAAAAVWYVDSTLGSDANSCTAPGPGNACQTIQAERV
jgi:hypothetical protein